MSKYQPEKTVASSYEYHCNFKGSAT